MQFFRKQSTAGKIILSLILLVIICCVCSIPLIILAPKSTPETVSGSELVIETVEPLETPGPTNTPTAEIKGLVKAGIHLVGSDIQPGIYVGKAGEDLFNACYWARLSDLTGSRNVIANSNAEGLYYVEVLPNDKALETKCELLPIEQVPAKKEFLTTLSTGTYILGRDIEAGVYRGEAGNASLESCYWARLRNVNGFNDTIANANATGQYFVEVLPTDFALQVDCQVEKVS